jgi:hypothetical protein
MAETTADVRRDIELTRERMSSTIAQLEQKLNLGQVVKDHPWPALGLAFGAGLLLSGMKTDTKAAVATLAATKGAGSKLGSALDDIVANLMQSVGDVMQGHVETMLNEVKQALGAPAGGSNGGTRSSFASYSGAPQLADTANHPATPAVGSRSGDGSGWSQNESAGRAD